MRAAGGMPPPPRPPGGAAGRPARPARDSAKASAPSSPGLWRRAICYERSMLSSARLFQAVALPYQLVTRHPVWERHCALMAQQLPPRSRLVVDVGCGPGNSAKHLRDAVAGTVIGIDPAGAMLALARRRDSRLA